MKKWVILGLVFLGFGGLVVWSIIDKQASSADFQTINENSIISGNQYNGNIADHVKGNPNAKVIIYEYADPQCAGCASASSRLNRLLDEYGDRLGLVYRNFLLSYHQNATAAASAAEAAGLQGYWSEYMDLLFANQAVWQYDSASTRVNTFVSYFDTVTGGKGDTEKFKSDLTSGEVKKKIEFDAGLAKKIGVSQTPTIIIDGEQIDFSKHNSEEKFLELLKEKINQALEKAEQK